MRAFPTLIPTHIILQKQRKSSKVIILGGWYQEDVEVKKRDQIPTSKQAFFTLSTTVVEEIRRTLAAEKRELEGRFAAPKPGDFGKWASAKLADADGSNGELARSYAQAEVFVLMKDLLRSRRSADGRWRESKTTKPKKASIPKKDMGQYLRGVRAPGPMVAYRIGRAIEEILVDRFLDSFNAELDKLELDTSLESELLSQVCEEVSSNSGSWLTVSRAAALQLLRLIGMKRASCGLDALLVAGYWADVIGCIGEYAGIDESLGFVERYFIFGNLLAYRTQNGAMPRNLCREIDQAFIKWISNPDVRRLPPRLGAAYNLALINDPLARAEAVQVLKRWIPRGALDASGVWRQSG